MLVVGLARTARTRRTSSCPRRRRPWNGSRGAIRHSSGYLCAPMPAREGGRPRASPHGPREPGPPPHRVHGLRRRRVGRHDGHLRRGPPPHPHGAREGRRGRGRRDPSRACFASPRCSRRSTASTRTHRGLRRSLPPRGAGTRRGPRGARERRRHHDAPGRCERARRPGRPHALDHRRHHQVPPSPRGSAEPRRMRSRTACTFSGEAQLPTKHGDVLVRGYRDERTGDEHVALIAPPQPGVVPIVRVHSECLTGDAFGSLRCDCGPQLDAAIEAIVARGRRRHLHHGPRGTRHRDHQQDPGVRAPGPGAATPSTRTPSSACPSTGASTGRRPRSSTIWGSRPSGS